MERPQGRIEQPTDEYDYEIPQLEADAVAFADELLKKKPEGSRMTFVDIVFQGDSEQMRVELEQSPFGHLLAAPDEQLAIESDGSYYPVLDVRKADGEFLGMGLRVWGWDDTKIRYTKDREAGPPYEFKEYQGEVDKTRQLEVALSYRVGQETVTEDVSIFFGTSLSGGMRAHSQLHMMAYAETGYEGHGGKSMKKVNAEDAYWFMDFIARHVGDEPKSIHEVQEERVSQVRAVAKENGALGAVDKLIADTWNAQAMYLMSLPCKKLEGKSILQSITNPEKAAQVEDAVRDILAHWKKGTTRDCFIMKLEGTDDE